MALMVGGFLACFYLPVGQERFDNAVMEALVLLKWYARKHVLLCLVPAFFIAGAIAEFISKESVVKYFGAQANKVVAYGVASVSGSILAVCSCTVLPLFAGIYRMGAGLGPASAFLYSGPAINVMAILLTARVLGLKIGIARALGAVVFSVVIGLGMAAIFGKEKTGEDKAPEDLFGSSAGKPVNPRQRLEDWLASSWRFAKQITPLLFLGVLVAGLLMGGPENGRGLIPPEWITRLVGGNSLAANLFASVIGALMYFATLTEVPIIKGLIDNGMGQGPVLALLLAGPALSLPNMLVIRSVLGTKKTVVFVLLVVTMATFSGMMFGWIVR